MECFAHHAREIRLQQDPSSLDGVKGRLSVNPELLKSSTVAAMEENPPIRRTLPKDRKLRVGVIGAGMAGLRCGHRLAEEGLEVLMLEARDRVGGRVHQVEFSGHLIDMGSNWIHGSNGNPMLSLAHSCDDTLYEPPDGLTATSPVFDAEGEEIDAKKAMAHSAIAWEIVDEAIRYSQQDGDSIPPERSLFDYFEQAVQVRGYDEQKSRLILDLADMWSNIVGEPIQMQSLRYMWLEECIEGENWFLASTYRAILEKVYQECVKHTDLQLLLSSKVRQVASVDQGDDDKQSVLISTDETSWTVDEVVVTVPLGYLKHHASMFTPSLPPKILKAIQHIGYGRLEKVYINFDHAFWLSGNAEKSNPFIFQFLTPRYAPEHNPKQWTIECVSLAALPPPHNHPTLLFYLHGPTSEYVTTLVRECKSGSAERKQKLEAFFQPYYSRLPNYSTTACRPKDFRSTDWQNDELAGCGSYSTYQTSDSKEGLVELDKDIDAIRTGYPERRLWFAGEHTAPTLALGTAAGAYWSGEAVADRLLQTYNCSSSRP